MVFVATALAGLAAGLAGAAGGLALNGRPLLGWEPARVQLYLVIGPLLGLWPIAALALLAHRSAAVRRWARAGIGLWLAVAITTTIGFGLVPLLR